MSIHINQHSQNVRETVVRCPCHRAAIENPSDVVVDSAQPSPNATCSSSAPTHKLVFRQSFSRNRVCSGVRPAVDLAVCEASYVNTPVIAVANTDSSLKFVDIVIPSDNKGRAVKLGFEVPHITDWAAASSGLGAALVKPLPQAQHPVWSLCLRRRLHCISAKADSAQLPSIGRYSFAITGYDPNQSTKTATATTTAGPPRANVRHWHRKCYKLRNS
ncbi:hypothetical protein niasHT_014508 [Heterodera trifolii]|uniref:Uncharacterized protein n=1 Tax=Heterodera trifolii TaxID=157864 RepID=A0ABD2KZK8_9BILA